MKIVVGLGNPGVQYSCTPHNVGFEAVDRIASEIGASWELKRAFNAQIARGVFNGIQVLLVKPQTFMNLSGDAVAPIVRYHNATVADVLVVQDDIDLPVGKIRIRKNGSAGGHNGLRSLIARLGTQEFQRIKIGVGKDRANVVGHVLGKFDPQSAKVIDEVLSEVVKVAATVLKDGPDRAMNVWNGWSAHTAEA